MKLKYFFPFFVAVIAAVFTSCSDDNDPTYLDEIRVSQSYVSLKTSGGTTSIDVIANGNWTVSEIPEWLTVSPTSGSGNGTITFSAGEGEGRTAEVLITCEGKTQRINIIQGIATVSNATCAEVLAGPDSKTYRVTGIVTSIANTTYGNWYLNDGTGEIYIYGTLDAKGATKNFLSLGLEVGDQVTVEGPKTTYGTTVELVDVTVIKIEKSLIKCDSLTVGGVKSDILPIEGGDIVAHLTCKGVGVAVEIPEEAQNWLGVVSSTVGENPTITFRAAPNAGGDRNTTVTFKTTDGKKEYTSQATINQLGAILEVPVKDFLAAEVGDTQYRITGVITELYSSDSQGKSFYIQDYSGKTLIYRAEGFIESGAKVGDIVTVVGKRGAYKDSPQMVSGNFESLNYAVTKVSIEEFNAKDDSKDVYYMVTGTVKDLLSNTGAENDYGNLHITDGTNELYVYGCYPGYGAQGDDRKGFIKAANIEVGDQLTIIGYKDTYKGLIELCGGIYFSHEKAE
ncbi:MAG: BACON domain-containing protein [Prevotella sp.]|nr:BACON domain-containing protein [Prevotella sp.]MBP5507912.1 BACON domain-containing protein [Prevotella sp.]